MSVIKELLNQNEEWVKANDNVNSLKNQLVNIKGSIARSEFDEQRLRLIRKKNGLLLALNNAERRLDMIEDEILVNYTNTYNRVALGYDCGITSDDYYEKVFEQNGLFNGIKF